MALHVCNGAVLKCAMAVPPGIGTLTVAPLHRMLTSNQPAANINDFVPLLNIPSFGMCMSVTNPLVIAATSAALGVPTPVPCLPITITPWAAGAPTVILDGAPALDNISTLTCVMGGTIAIMMPGQVTELIP